MTLKTTLLKGLLGATALSAFTAGTAFAQDTPVSNSFTLNYSVGGVAQPEIETVDDPLDNTDDNDPTTFVVDRLVKVVVTGGTDTIVAPDEDNAFVDFSVFNAGNDTHKYLLTESIDTTDFTPGAPTNTTPLVYFIDTNDNGVLDGAEDASPIPYDASNPPALAPDATIIVRVYRDISDGTDAADGESAPVTLVADTRENTPAFADVTADTGGNDAALAENVLADGQSVPAAEGNNDGSDAAIVNYTVLAADVEAVKTVAVINQDGTGCASFATAATPGSYYVPGACVEYTITVTNDGTAAAAITELEDILPDGLEYQNAQITGDLTGTLAANNTTPAALTAGDDCDSGECVITVTSGSIAGDGGGAASTGTLVIRATIK